MKKSFLTSLSLLATTLAADASAALPSNVLLKIPEIKTNEQTALPSPFVLDKPDNNGGLFVAGHSSHASHASHSSHYSSR